MATLAHEIRQIRVGWPWLRLALGLGLGAACLALGFRQVEFASFVVSLTNANLAWVGIALGTGVATNLVKALRWQALLGTDTRRVPVSRLFAVLLLGQSVNVLVPGRAGELARAYLLSQRERLSMVRTLGTIAVEKALDGVMLGLWLGAALAAMPLPAWISRPGLLLSALFLVGLMLLTVIGGRHTKMQRLVERVSLLRNVWMGLTVLGVLLIIIVENLPLLKNVRIADLFDRFREGLAGLADARARWRVVGYSLLVWSLATTTNVVLFVALGIDVSLWAAVVLLVVIHLGALIPAAPAQVGLFPYLSLVTLSLFGMSESPALAFGVVLYAVVFLPVFLLTALLVWGETLNLRDLAALKQAASQPDAGPARVP